MEKYDFKIFKQIHFLKKKSLLFVLLNVETDLIVYSLHICAQKV
jgi:hypothetical protein